MQKHYLSNNDSLLKKASYLRIVAKDLADIMKTGNFSSLYKGQGVEFAGVRDYIRGDDIRAIDWNVTARMGHPYIKIFDEERELQIFIIIDTSESMQLETGDNRSKYSAAAEAAALITMAAEINNCPIGSVFFDGEIQFSCKPRQDKENTMMILNHLDKLCEKQTKGSALGSALNGAGKLLKKRSMVFVFSDFRTNDWEKPMIALAHKNNVIAFRMQDSYQYELPSIGTVIFEDVESDLKMELPTSSEAFKKAWKTYNNQHQNRWQDFCIQHGIIPVTMDSKADPLQILNAALSKKMR